MARANLSPSAFEVLRTLNPDSLPWAELQLPEEFAGLELGDLRFVGRKMFFTAR